MARQDKPSPNEMLFRRKVRDTKAIALSLINDNGEKEVKERNLQNKDGKRVESRNSPCQQKKCIEVTTFRQGDEVRV